MLLCASAPALPYFYRVHYVFYVQYLNSLLPSKHVFILFQWLGRAISITHQHKLKRDYYTAVVVVANSLPPQKEPQKEPPLACRSYIIEPFQQRVFWECRFILFLKRETASQTKNDRKGASPTFPYERQANLQVTAESPPQIAVTTQERSVS